MRIGRWQFAPTTLAFGGATFVTVVLSILLTMRQAGATLGPRSARRFSGSEVVQKLPSVLAAARLPSPVRVLVVREDAAAGYHDTPATLDSMVQRWRRELAAVGADASIVSPAELANAMAGGAPPVVVVPDSPCLSLATHEAIARLRERGGGLVITGRAAVNDAACRPIGLGFVVAASGASRAAPLDGRDMVYVTIPAGGPLAADIPPGSRLELRPSHQLALRAAGRDAFYSDYALQPLPAGGHALLDGALAHSTLGRARVVYWGFELGDGAHLAWTQQIMRLLVRNSVAWAAGEPVGAVEPWPGGKRAAAAIAQDVEAGFADARAALDTLRALNVRSTYFVISNLARKNADLSRAFPAAGEIGSHTENHRLLGGQAAATQTARLERTQSDLAGLLGEPVLGLRPPEEQFDEATLAGWLAAGGTYLFGANDSRSAAPELLKLPGHDRPLVLLGRVGGDDFAVLSLARARKWDTDHVASTFLDEYDRFRALGGMYVLSYHSQNVERPEMLGALARVATTIARDTSVWLATTGEIASWWQRRAQLAVRVSGEPGRSLTVAVRNGGMQPINGAVVRVSVPGAAAPLGATARLLAAPKGSVRLALPTIPAGAVREYTVRWTSERSASASSSERAARRSHARRSLPWWKRLFR